MTIRSKRFKPVRAENIHVDSIGAGGDGIGQFEGKKVFIPKTAPGDVVNVQIESQNAQGLRGHVLERIQDGLERQAPPCPHYQNCGGCGLQHVTDDFYRRWKIEAVQETLRRVGIIPERWETHLFIDAATRRRTTLKAIRRSHTLTLGYNASRSHDTVNMTQCMILTPHLQQTVQGMRPYLTDIIPEKTAIDIFMQDVSGAIDLVLTGNLAADGRLSLTQNEALAAMVQDCDIARISWRKQIHQTPEILLNRNPVIGRFGPLSVHIPPGAFLQASTEGETALQNFVTRNLENGSSVIDLFCGCGTLSGAALQAAATVHGAELDENAITALAGARHPKLSVIKRDLFRDPFPAGAFGDYDAAILDPPRAGAMAQIKELANSDVPKIIYISCNAASFARDARILVDGGYRLETIQIIDQFVWSAHTEIAAVFKKNSPVNKAPCGSSGL